MIAEVASQAHNLKVVGSNPTPATKLFLTIKIRLDYGFQESYKGISSERISGEN